MSRTPVTDDWAKWREHVLAELKRLSGGIETINGKFDSLHKEDIQEIWTEIAVLKVKAGVWGFAAGLIPGLSALLYEVLHK